MKSSYTDSLAHTTFECKYHIVFWCRGYYVSTVGNNNSAVYNYVENQLKEDMMSELVIEPYRLI